MNEHGYENEQIPQISGQAYLKRFCRKRNLREAKIEKVEITITQQVKKFLTQYGIRL